MPARESLGLVDHERVNIPKNIDIQGKTGYSFTFISSAGDLKHSHTRTFPHIRLTMRKCLKFKCEHGGV